MARLLFVVTLSVALGCGGDGDAAGPRLACERGCTQRKSQCVVAATNAAELELCDRRHQRCTSECSP